MGGELIFVTEGNLCGIDEKLSSEYLVKNDSNFRSKQRYTRNVVNMYTSIFNEWKHGMLL